MGKWFVQAQQPTRYLREESNFCVTANYTILDSKTIKVVNYANDKAVNGKSRGGELRAVIKDATVPSKLSVGPKFLPNFLKGPYWVVATGPISEGTGLYSWAVIVGGEPTFENKDTGKCYAGNTNPFNFNGNGEGMWIFSRKQVEDDAIVSSIKEIMDSELGLDVSVLNKVSQQGCLYQ
jgi:lipocalin